jgi:hypothetical protein
MRLEKLLPSITRRYACLESVIVERKLLYTLVQFCI